MWVLFARDHSFERPDSNWISFSEEIWDQDQAITEQQHPEMLPVDLSEEIHLRVADAPGIALRRLLREAGLDYA